MNRPESHRPVPPDGATQPLATLLRQAAAELQLKQAPAFVAASAVPGAAAPRRAWLGRLRPRLSMQPAAWAMGSMLAFSLLVAVLTGSEPAPKDSEFVAVAGAERWLRLGSEGGAAWLVHTEMPAERLAAYGLPYDPGRAAQPVRAELLMRASGEVLALRIID